MSDIRRWTVEVDGELWLYESIDGSSIWPAGDPCPNDKESLTFIRKIESLDEILK